MKPHDERLKEELLQRGLLREAQLQSILAECVKTRASLKEVVLKMSSVPEEELAVIEADISGIPFLDISQYLIDPKLLSLIPEKTARAHWVIPVFKVGNRLTVATWDPLNLIAFDEVKATSGCEVEMVISTRDMIKRTIDQHYGVSGGVADLVKSYEKGLQLDSKAYKLDEQQDVKIDDDPKKAAEEAPVIQLVNFIIMRALEEKASDIHIEPEEDFLRVRNRIDGILHEASTIPKKMSLAVASRVKIMAKLDIAQTRAPQDGRIRLKVENRDVDLRVSTFPTTYGENIVMRILERSKVSIGLTDLGFAPETLKSLETLVHKAYGMVLVTGPTGSGKTTTLYAALNTINTMDKNIITIEDPVEYQLTLIRQTQVNVKAGLTFAAGLRSILRQDPDVILVGEIRDGETADIAIQAALTGHLVFSTIHTNDAAGAVVRLSEMGVENFLIASSLLGVLAQRLVRTICKKCKESYKLDEKLLKSLGLSDSAATFYRGKGCAQCKETGYGGRVSICELLVVDETIRRLILTKASSDDIRATARKNGMITMREDGIQKALKGITTLEEVLRVTLEGE